VLVSPCTNITKEDNQITALGQGIRFGDINADGIIDSGDVLYLVNCLYKNAPSPLPWWFVGDADYNMMVDIEDILYLVDCLYKFGPSHAIPVEKQEHREQIFKDLFF